MLLNESADGEQSDDEALQQAAYLAAVIWRREQQGLYTEAEAERELDRIANMGVSQPLLFTAYEMSKRHGASLGWLDLDFQTRTLRKFLPDEDEPMSEPLSGERAA